MYFTSGDLLAGSVVFFHALGRGRMLDEHSLRTGRALHQIAAAIGAKAAQPGPRTVRAEGAFVGAHQRVGRAVGQVLVAAFAVGAEVEHGPSLTPRGSGFPDAP